MSREQLDNDLARLNKAVEAALAERKAWMDSHMPDYAKYKIGEELFDLKTGERLSVVSSYYRYWSGHNPSLDTTMNIEYQFETSRNCFDNTSRQPARSIGNAEELEWKRRPRTPVNWDKVFG
jgi:hypothetical protein